MMNDRTEVLRGLKPAAVFRYFEALSAIPHGSGNTAAISAYCVAFAKEQGLSCDRDAIGNVIIRKPASAGFEDHPAVILQGHLDMVCEKEPDCTHDFSKDGIVLRRDGDCVFADGTTLGGDDGIAVAMIMALLADQTAAHPPLEAVFTVDEETGMYGAAALDMSKLNGTALINIDSEEEGVMIAGCAGGARVNFTVPLNAGVKAAVCRRVTLGGLRGGHSGTEIDRGHPNATLLLAAFLDGIGAFRLCSLNGGTKDNAIPRTACAVVETEADLNALARDFVEAHKTPTEPDLFIRIEQAPACDAFDAPSAARALDVLRRVPNGVQTMSADVPGLVQTSLNLGILTSDKAGLHLSFSVRSSKTEERDALVDMLRAIAAETGEEASVVGVYPAWEFCKNSRLRDTAAAVFYDCFGKEPTVTVLHAGLECGLFAEKMPHLDMISIGPDLFDVHTPDERLSVSSAERTYRYLLALLKRL